MLAIQLAHIDFLDEQIEALSTAIAASLAALSAEETAPSAAGAVQGASLPTAPEAPPVLTFTRAVELLDTIPGVDGRGAELILAEIGIDMTRFETAPRLAAWAGVAPGNNESAGKQRSSTTRKGNQALRAGLTQLAQAAARTKETYLSALYGRLAALLSGAGVGTPVGVWGLATLPASWLRRLIGLILMGVVLIEWRDLYPRTVSGRSWCVAAGVFSGLLGGAIGTPGPPVMLYAAAQGWPPRAMTATLQGFFFANQLLILMSQWWAGRGTTTGWGRDVVWRMSL